MAYEKRDNSGSLFKNDRREKDSHPTHTGTIMVEGREFWLSAWVKEANGKKFFSLSVKPKEAQRPAQDAGRDDRHPEAQSPMFDDSAPF